MQAQWRLYTAIVIAALLSIPSVLYHEWLAAQVLKTEGFEAFIRDVGYTTIYHVAIGFVLTPLVFAIIAGLLAKTKPFASAIVAGGLTFICMWGASSVITTLRVLGALYMRYEVLNM